VPPFSPETKMTIKELKALIKDLDDSMSVVIQHNSDEYISPGKSESKVKTLYSDEGENPYMLFASNDGMEEYEALVLNRF
jgi:hypothetical protein